MRLTRDRLLELLTYNPETGIFTWNTSRAAHVKSGDVAGYKRKDGYILIMIDGKNYRAHRLAWMYVHGSWPSLNIDHRDHDTSNNCIRNIRDLNQSGNMQNILHAHADSRTGLLGVTYDKVNNRYRAQISINGKSKPIGRFDTAMEAHLAYVKIKREIHSAGTI